MKVTVISSAALLLLLVQGCNLETSRMQPQGSPSPVEALTPDGITEDRAIAIANQEALKTHKSIAYFDIIACEQSLVWAIIYDGDNSEYHIDKGSGEVLQVRKIPQGLAGHTGRPPERMTGISEQEAIDVARKDFRATYGSQSDANLVIRACELAAVWRVVFDVKLTERDNRKLPDAHSPTYIVDKKTREMLDRQLY